MDCCRYVFHAGSGKCLDWADSDCVISDCRIFPVLLLDIGAYVYKRCFA